MAKQDVTVELFYDSQWNDHTSSVYARDVVSITRGKGDEQGKPTPSSCTLTFDNRDGTFNPRNSSSSLFGKIGRNTPLRVRLASATEGFEDTDLEFTTTDAGDVAWARASDQAHSGTWSLKSGNVTDEQDSIVLVAVPGGADVLEFWYRVSSEEDFDLFEVYGIDTGWSDITDGTLLLEASGEVDWTRAEVDCHEHDLIAFRFVKDESVSEGSDVAWIDDLTFYAVRFTGEIASWKPRRAIKGDAWTEVTAAGVLRRTEQSGVLRSPHTRAVAGASTAPLAWWSLEDPERATSAASGVVGVEAMRPVATSRYTTGNGTPIPPGGAPKFGTGVGPAGSGKLVELTGGGTLFGYVPRGPNTDEWAVEFVVRFGTDAGTFNESVVTVSAEGTYKFFEFNFIESQVRVFHGAAFPTNDGRAVADFPVGDGTAHHVLYTVSQSGGNYLARLYVDGTLAATADNFGSAMTGTVGRVTRVDVNPLDSAGTGLPNAVGQITVWGTETPAVDTVEAAFGWLGETAADRVERLCDEEGIAFTLIGTASDTVAMGPQPFDTFNAVVAEAERTDGGRLFESRDEAGITYRTRTSLYNQTAALELDFDGGQILPTLEPDIDDLNVRNDITVKNPDGAFYQAVQETGTLNVQAPSDDPDGVGRYAVEVDVNDASADALQQHAGWRLHLGTVEETRYPAVSVDVDIVPAAADLDIGDLITIDNIPDDPDGAQLLVIGYTETVATHRRVITFNCEPATPYRVFVLDTDELDGPAVLGL